MKLIDALNKLENSEEFNDWKIENDDSFLVHFFIMDSDNVNKEWQIGYYNPKTDMIVTFVVNDETITLNPETEVFKEHKGIKPLDVNLVSINFDQAKDIAKRVQEQKYSVHLPLKKIFILQNIEAGHVWNVTYITQSFKTLNIKVDSENGDIVEDNLVEVFSFDKGK
jgi:hypothetical protein